MWAVMPAPAWERAHRKVITAIFQKRGVHSLDIVIDDDLPWQDGGKGERGRRDRMGRKPRGGRGVCCERRCGCPMTFFKARPQRDELGVASPRTSNRW